MPFLFSQETSATYFQQKVDYEIDVTLDDVRNELRGYIRIHYTHHGPEAIERIPIHLWPNAYASKESAFAEQQLRLGKLDFLNATAEKLGFLDSLSFSVSGNKLAMRPDADHRDVAWLKLPEPVATGEQVTIEGPFRVKIPSSFSRLGHVWQSYQVTQWYPKPAVLDEDGWHVMPYLDQGEFYNDFGDYTVRITLPRNYVVAATGELNTPGEIEFLHRKIKGSSKKPVTKGVVVDTIPPSSKQVKTIEYHAMNVPDFAWFADKRFRVDTSSVVLQNGHRVKTWAFYTKSESEFWHKATTYLNRSVSFYAEHVGHYPWPQVTAVQSPLSEGVGMEYPMITLIGLSFTPQALDQVITHEVGHNWFYGLLASNERAYPWMDEGINSFYEQMYMQENYGVKGNAFLPKAISRNAGMSDVQAIYFDLSHQHKLRPPKAGPFDQDGLSYYLNAYEIPALAFRFIREMMGHAAFDEAMGAYFDQWKFRHPGPEDLRKTLEDYCACDLGWFTEGLMERGGTVDYAVVNATPDHVVIENKGEVMAPVEIILSGPDVPEQHLWVDGFTGRKSIALELKGVREISLYKPDYSLDADWSNNSFRPSSLFPKLRPLRFRIGTGIAGSDRSSLYLLPLTGLNEADQGMIGVGITNQQLPNPALRWILAPMYGIRSRDLVGMAEVRRDFTLRSGWFDRLMVRGSLKRFNDAYDPDYAFANRYTKAEVKAELHFRKPERFSATDQWLSLRFAQIHQRFSVGIDIQDNLFAIDKRGYYVNELRYFRKQNSILFPNKLDLRAQQGKGFLKFLANFRQQVTYRKKSRGLYMHFFGGLLAVNDQPDANVNFLFNGQPGSGIFARDYLFDEILLGRNAKSGIFSQQVFLRDAELKTLSTAGFSENWMLGGGFSTSLPIPLPIHAYADFAIFPDPLNNKVSFSYSSGLAIVAAKDFLEIYFPVFESTDIRESVTYAERSGYFERVSFLFNLKALHPFDLGDHFFEFLYR